MTWIVGRSPLFGYAVGLSDIRVTLRDGRERDCLQKVYAVGPMLALGFAGSVAIGFSMVRRLAGLLRLAEPGLAWDPTIVADWWPADAKGVFDTFTDSEKVLQSHLIMLGAHPSENVGSEVGWERCYVYRFRSPDFAPQLAAAMEIVSIGSGEGVEPYVKALRDLGDSFEVLQLEAGLPGGSGLMLMHAIAKVIEDAPAPGISRHLQICLVRRSGIRFGNNDQEWSDRQDRIISELKMPPVAHSLEQLTNLLNQAGLSATGAVC